MSNLFAAHHQWSKRPADERFWTVKEMAAACKEYADTATTVTVHRNDMRVEQHDQAIALTGNRGIPATLTHHAFGQLCQMSGSPAGFLRNLPPTLAVQVLNNRLKHVADNREEVIDEQGNVIPDKAELLVHKNGSYVARALTSQKYDRVWNYQLCDRLLDLTGGTWRVPPARPAVQDPRARKATAADLLPGAGDYGISVKVGDMIAPAGLYASDKDMFAFLVDPNRVISIGKRALMRGMFVRNSEVGDGSLRFTFFLLDGVCGNHICWNTSEVKEVRIKHIAGKGERNQQKVLNAGASKFALELRKYENEGASKTEGHLTRAMRFEIPGENKAAVIDAVFGWARKSSLNLLSKSRLSAAYDLAESDTGRFGNPNTPFALMSGMTELSQSDGFADKRNDIDIQAGRLLDLANGDRF